MNEGNWLHHVMNKKNYKITKNIILQKKITKKKL